MILIFLIIYDVTNVFYDVTMTNNQHENSNPM